jgi:ABC-type bacteriocin/lantibiotic exporter with double-glycine peptidase domain
MQHLRIRSFQETRNAGRCGPASLKMVLSYFGVHKSEASLARLCGTKRVIGTDVAGLVRAAEQLGFNVYVKEFSTFRDIQKWLKRGVPVIVDWFSKGRAELTVADGHYSVVIGLDRNWIYLVDPEFGRRRRLSRPEFRRVWFDYEGEYVRSRKDMIIRQIIVVQPPATAREVIRRRAA